MCFRLLFLCLLSWTGFPVLLNVGLSIVLEEHQVPETTLEIERVVLLQKGRVVPDVAKEELLTKNNYQSSLACTHRFSLRTATFAHAPERLAENYFANPSAMSAAIGNLYNSCW